jgi:cell division protein FtsL
VEVSLEQNAYRNARAYYNKKKNAQKKYEKTMNTSEKVFIFIIIIIIIVIPYYLSFCSITYYN